MGEGMNENNERIDPMTNVFYLMDVHGLPVAGAYQLAQQNLEAVREDGDDG
jgi:hypothetical protein